MPSETHSDDLEFAILEALSTHAFASVAELALWLDSRHVAETLVRLRADGCVDVADVGDELEPQWCPTAWAKYRLDRLTRGRALAPVCHVSIETGDRDRADLSAAAHALQMVVVGPELTNFSGSIRTPELTMAIRASSEAEAHARARKTAIRLRRVAGLADGHLGATKFLTVDRQAA